MSSRWTISGRSWRLLRGWLWLFRLEGRSGRVELVWERPKVLFPLRDDGVQGNGESTGDLNTGLPCGVCYGTCLVTLGINDCLSTPPHQYRYRTVTCTSTHHRPPPQAATRPLPATPADPISRRAGNVRPQRRSDECRGTERPVRADAQTSVCSPRPIPPKEYPKPRFTPDISNPGAHTQATSNSSSPVALAARTDVVVAQRPRERGCRKDAPGFAGLSCHDTLVA